MAKAPTASRPTTTRPSAAAAAGASAKRKPLKKKPKYAVPEGGLTEVPADYSLKTHAPLVRADFKDEHVFLSWKADTLQKRVDFYRKQAEMSQKLGNAEDRKAAKKLIAMKARMAELAAELKEQGLDVDSILADDGSEDGEE